MAAKRKKAPKACGRGKKLVKIKGKATFCAATKPKRRKAASRKKTASPRKRKGAGSMKGLEAACKKAKKAKFKGKKKSLRAPCAVVLA